LLTGRYYILYYTYAEVSKYHLVSTACVLDHYIQYTE
jgi:hypothetical protein